MLRHKLNGLSPGTQEEPVEIELMGESSLPEFIKALKDAFKEAGPRFGVIPTPQWKLADIRRRARMAGKAGGDEGPKSLPQRLILRRPVTIKSSNPKKNAVVDMGTVGYFGPYWTLNKGTPLTLIKSSRNRDFSGVSSCLRLWNND